jgi:hypothetical protein
MEGGASTPTGSTGMSKQAQWMRLPRELKQRQQWLLAAPDAEGKLKVPVTVNRSGELCPGSSTDRACWLPFEVAIAEASHRGLGIGYVLAADDPFACIDLDVKTAQNKPGKPDEWTSPEQLDRYLSIARVFDCYAERSQSGLGLHIWAQGKIGKGVKRDGVEVYSQERFIVCTGDVWMDKPLHSRQEWLTNMVAQMRAAGDERSEVMVEVEAELDDAELWERASTAANADKFLPLWNGDWEKVGEYPSQSEADLSLMSMLAFYSRSNEQCRRVFRMSGLGKREKATKNDRYLNYTLSLIRGRQAREAKAEVEALALAAPLIQQAQQRALALQEVQRLQGAPAQLHPAASVEPPAIAQSFFVPPGAGAGVELAQLPAPPVVQGPEGELPWPPGLAGAIAGFVYRNAHRPVKEVAIVAALGWLAGVCGRAYMIRGSGLNLYVILVARSAIGKESMHSGLSSLTQALLSNGYITASRFIDYSDFASGPALRKAVSTNPSFLNVSGEWGRKLRRLGADNSNDGPMQSLRTEMTLLYQKSGPSAIVGGMTYSKKEDNVASVAGVNYSMIGETTPETFYQALTETMMEDGFLSRFSVVEYTGLRPPANNNPVEEPEPELLQACGALVIQASRTMDARKQVLVSFTPEAKAVADAFDSECDAQINRTVDEGWRQMWNRAHLKALRIAALLGVADNCVDPVVRQHHVEWALLLVRKDIAIMQRKMAAGEVGNTDNSREQRIMTMCKEYLTSVPKGYHIPDHMHAQGVVPRKYFQMRLQRSPLFANARGGGIRALDETLRSLVDSGYLVEVDKAKATDSFGFQGRCYRIVNLPGGLLD